MARWSSSEVPENQWSTQAHDSAHPVRSSTSMTVSADRTAWSDRTLPPPSAQAWATRSNAASCTSREAACAGAKSRPTSPTKRASLASCSNCATSSSVAAAVGHPPGVQAQGRAHVRARGEQCRRANVSGRRHGHRQGAYAALRQAGRQFPGVFREVQMAMQVEQAQGRVAFRHVSFGSAFRFRMRILFSARFRLSGRFRSLVRVTLLGQGAPAFRLGMPFVFRLCHAHSPPMPASVHSTSPAII